MPLPLPFYPGVKWPEREANYLHIVLMLMLAAVPLLFLFMASCFVMGICLRFYEMWYLVANSYPNI
jgi:hypothetical protein